VCRSPALGKPCKNRFVTIADACKTFRNTFDFEAIMSTDSLTADLFSALCATPIYDTHSHVDPFQPAARSLDDLLGYHYYAELAHTTGMGHESLRPEVDPRERCRAILTYSDLFDNTTQYAWLLEIARTFLGFTGDRITAADCDALFDTSLRVMSHSDWERHVTAVTKLDRAFLTNSFDDRLDGFDRNRYIPCLRTDDLVFQMNIPQTRERLAGCTGIDVGDWPSLRKAIGQLFERFVQAGARACAISLPPEFTPMRPGGHSPFIPSDPNLPLAVFWMIAEFCRDFCLPFDLMIGVNRQVYPAGVFQGQDLFDQRTSLIQYAELFNAFPEVTFPISVLSSGQNQELVSYAWIFPNVFPHGHWWYSNVPAYIEANLRARLQAVPKTKLLGYYSDAYKLEFVLPKFNMYRRVLARVLADDFVRPGRLSERSAAELGLQVMRGNAERLFGT
jgi:glucuronate isomerase